MRGGKELFSKNVKGGNQNIRIKFICRCLEKKGRNEYGTMGGAVML
jgi:hypothetical protein